MRPSSSDSARLNEAQESAEKARTKVRMIQAASDFVGQQSDPESLQAAKAHYADVLRKMHDEVLVPMHQAGIRAPAIGDENYQDMQRLGLEIPPSVPQPEEGV
jgi:hypothetical protein